MFAANILLAACSLKTEGVNFFGNKYFSYEPMLSKGVAPLCIGRSR